MRYFFCQCIKTNKQKSQLSRVGRQERGCSCALMITEPNRKKKDSSPFLAKTQPMKRNGHCLTFLPSSFPLYNSDLFPWPFEDLHIAPHSCKHWTTIFHWYHKPVSAREMSDTLFVSCQQRGRGLTWSGDLWKTQKGNLFPWHIWMYFWLTLLRLMKGRTIKIKKKKNQEKTTRDKFVRQFKLPEGHTTPLECSTSCLRL